MKLDKQAALFERDEKGNLIPQEVKLEINEEDEQQLQYKGTTISVTPIPRGKIKRLFAKISEDKKSETDFDSQIILEHCIDPKFTEDEIKHLKPELATPIVNTIFKESGVFVGGKSKKKAIVNAEDDFAKNS